MEKVDLVMVGAEGVAESGGIINKVDGLAVAASAYVALVNRDAYASLFLPLSFFP